MEAKQTATPIYASGTKGESVRADGNGGVLARGWWAPSSSGMIGPFKSAALAKAGAA